ncbi:recombinase family protein [Ancylomarina sp. YFZ004]
MDAIIYARVSTSKQDTERQVKELLEYSKLLKLNIVEVIEESISGTKKANEREGMTLLQQITKEKNIKHVVTWELSRIGRNLRNSVNILYDFIDQGVCVHSKKENIRTLNEDGSKNNNATMIISVFLGVAETELETMKMRVKSGLRNSKLNGGANAAVQPFGFYSKEKKLAVHCEESQIVKLIYDQYIAGVGMLKIARHLNEIGIPTRKNKKWVDKTINTILKNALYKGKRYHNDEKVPYNLDIIIPVEKWEKVQSIIKSKANKYAQDASNINLVKGLLYCGNCGEPMFMHRRSNLRDNAYKCLSQKSGYKTKSCDLTGINIDLLNLLTFLCHTQTGSFDFDKILSKVEQDNKTIKLKIANLEKEIDVINSELLRLTKGYMKKIVPEIAFAELSKTSQQDLTKAEVRLVSLRQKLQITPEKPKKFSPDNGIDGNQLIGEFAKSIRRIEIYNIPLNETPFNQRKDNVAYKVKFFIKTGEESINFISSRDKRIFDRNFHATPFSLTNTKKIDINN